MSGAVPKLRFPEFNAPWDSTTFGTMVERVSYPVDVDPTATYREIGVRSHGKGVFHKEAALGVTIGEKRVFSVVPETLVLNIVFAWEQAVALTTQAEAGFIASHRFPMFRPKDGKADLRYLLRFLLTKKGKALLELASPGGAGRNKTLGQQDFLKLKTIVPAIAEQRKIASFLGAVDDKISGLRRKEAALVQFKAGLMQKLFSQKLRFTRDDGSAFPDWKEKQLGALVDLISGQHLGPNDYASDAQGLPYFSGPSDFTNSHREVTKWTTTPAVKVALPGDTLITVKGSGVGELLSLRFASVAMGRQLMAIRGTAIDGRLVYHRLSSERHEFQARAAGNMIPGLSRSDILSLKFTLPTHPEEQRKIADALSMLDAKNDSVRSQISKMETFKKGLLQQMFV